MVDQLRIATTPWGEQTAMDVESLCEQAETAEEMGLHSFWLPESHFGKSRSVPAPLLLLAAVAARTSTLKLGCVSYLLPIRNPLLAAEEVAVLDQLSAGRLILGLGRGIQPQMFAAFGIDSMDKRELFADHLQIMRRAWRGDSVAQDGSGSDIVLSPLPHQRPEPVLWVAAFGPKALRQVAGLGLPYLASPLESLARLKENFQNFHLLVAEAGLEPVSTVPVMRSVYISDNDQQLRTLRTALADQVPAAMRDRSGEVEQWAIIGSPDYVENQLGLYREELGMTHLILRGGLPGITASQQIKSNGRLLSCKSLLTATW